jgi:hypothetical protein
MSPKNTASIYFQMDIVFSSDDIQCEVEVVTTGPAAAAEAASPPAAPASDPLVDSLATNDDLAAVLDRDPSLFHAAWSTLLASKSTGTVRTYSRVVSKFQDFCTSRNYAFPNYTADTLLQYILTAVKENASFHRLATLKPALTLLDTAPGRPSVFTPLMDTLLSGAKRTVRARAGPVRKAAPVSLAHLTALLDKHYVPHHDQPQFIAPVMFRTLLAFSWNITLSAGTAASGNFRLGIFNGWALTLLSPFRLRKTIKCILANPLCWPPLGHRTAPSPSPSPTFAVLDFASMMPRLMRLS